MRKHFKGKTYWLTQEAMNGLIEELEEAQRVIGVMQEALQWSVEFFEARDKMNAKVHCAPVRYSEITIRVQDALKGAR